jgi:hypothetical protein
MFEGGDRPIMTRGLSHMKRKESTDDAVGIFHASTRRQKERAERHKAR